MCVFTSLQNNIHLASKYEKKTFLNMTPAVKGFILTWKKKSTTWGPFSSMLRFEVHTLGKSTGLPKTCTISSSIFFCTIDGVHSVLLTGINVHGSVQVISGAS